MEYLIDTHVIIWALSDKKMLSPKVISILENPATKIFISPMSFFEIAIKLKVGKLPDFAVPLSEFINSALATGFEMLPIKNEHFFSYSGVDFSAGIEIHLTDILPLPHIMRACLLSPRTANSVLMSAL